ncbi:hypothetical protein B0H14DRAFT_2657553, partial [Mycena olivaceomarginata]
SWISFVEKYATACKAAGNDYSKNFCFPKQHFTGHALEDIREKGVLRNATTRIGEGTHQEVAQHWKMTIFGKPRSRVCNQDEDQETIARTRLIIDNFFADLAGTSPGSPEDRDEEEDIHDEGLQFKVRLGGRVPRSKLPPGSANNHWIFGSPFRHGDSGSYEDLYAQNDPIEIFRVYTCHTSRRTTGQKRRIFCAATTTGTSEDRDTTASSSYR